MLDSFDSKAIKFLIRHGRASWAELAGHLKLSAPAAADRVRRLEERGVIRGYTALIDPEAVGYPLTAFISVILESPQRRKAFLRTVDDLAEVMECHHVAGDYDYLLKVRCRGTRDLDRLLNDVLKAGPGIARTHTTIVLGSSKESIHTPVAPSSS